MDLNYEKKNSLFEIISCIEDADFKVLSITSDTVAENRSSLKALLNVSPENIYFNLIIRLMISIRFLYSQMYPIY